MLALGYLAVFPLLVAAAPVSGEEAASTSVNAEPQTEPNTSQQTIPPKKEAKENVVLEKFGERQRVFVLDFATHDVSASAGTIATGLCAAELSNAGQFEVLSGADVRRILNAEAAKQTTGCDSDDSCLAEVAGALGASLLLSGEVTQAGRALVVNLVLLDTASAKALSRQTVVARDLEEIPGRIEPACHNLMTSLTGEKQSAIPPPSLRVRMDDPAARRAAMIVAASTAAVTLAVGGIVQVGGFAALAALTSFDPQLSFLVSNLIFPVAIGFPAVIGATLGTIGVDVWVLDAPNVWRPVLVGAVSAVAVLGVGAITAAIGALAGSGLDALATRYKAPDAVGAALAYAPAIAAQLTGVAVTSAVSGGAYLLSIGFIEASPSE